MPGTYLGMGAQLQLSMEAGGGGRGLIGPLTEPNSWFLNVFEGIVHLLSLIVGFLLSLNNDSFNPFLCIIAGLIRVHLRWTRTIPSLEISCGSMNF